jgi:hypothetical protein
MTIRLFAEAIRWRVRLGKHWIPKIPARVEAWLALHRNRSAYRMLDEASLRATRKSDTVFIFGSGYSLNAITPREWSGIEAHDTIGFNWFVRESFVRCDYHFIREVAYTDATDLQSALALYCALIRDNPCYASTIFMVQAGFRATSGNRAIGHGLLPLKNPIYRWRTLDDRTLPSRSLGEGLSHSNGTLSECVNFAALMGWRHIVLAGVDLYDRRYFWLAEDEPLACDPTVEEPHKTAGIVDGLREWQGIFEAEGIHLYAYNPRSLLVPALPVWQWS